MHLDINILHYQVSYKLSLPLLSSGLILWTGFMKSLAANSNNEFRKLWNITYLLSMLN